MKEWCWLRHIVRSIRLVCNTGNPSVRLDGHQYVEDFNGQARVHVLTCRDCGHVSIAWEHPNHPPERL